MPMLHEFLIANRDEILTLSRAKLTGRTVPVATEAELVNGLPLFLDQIAEILRVEKGHRGDSHGMVVQTAGLHGSELLRMGLTVGQVVHDYGSICQSVTELADARQIEITADEFQVFNRCLDDAIAQAVTEYERERDRTVGGQGSEHLGYLAHEMRNLLTTAMLTFGALSRGAVGIQGSTGKMHARSLQRMRVLIDRTLAEVRLAGGTAKSERVCVAELIEELEVVASLAANERDVKLSVEAGPPDVVVMGDHQILASVVANLVQNAFKFTKRSGHIAVRAHATDDRVLIDVQDECGGLPPGSAAGLFKPFEQRHTDKRGLGLGLSISLKGVRASGGDIRVRDIPGTGCVFTVDLPRSATTH